MTPTGRFVLNILEVGLIFDLQFLANIIGSLILFVIGIMFVQVGYEESQGLGKNQ